MVFVMEDFMLEKTQDPGGALGGARSGLEKTVYFDADFAPVPETLNVSSPTFDDEGAIPKLYTADGRKISPPVAWSGIPRQAQSLVLIVEDPDAPGASPFIHAIVLDIPADSPGFAEGDMTAGGNKGNSLVFGRNAYRKPEYIPPDPPPGHGRHRYLFQLYALDRRTGLAENSARSGVIEAMRGHVVAKGLLIGTYERK
jgi:Raf kinase inhibitor-like YbhB/YbcL family protein